MTIKKFVVCFIIVLLMGFPASAADMSLNRWILNVTLNEDGLVDELIQVELKNSGSSPVDGFAFVIPASKVEVIYDFDHTFSSKGQMVEQQIVNNGIKLIVNFNTSIKNGEAWNGRIGFRAENFAKKMAQDYSIEIPVNAPEAIISGKTADIEVPQDADIRGQVFLPKGVEVISVTPKPFRILFQNSHMVPTWTPESLRIKDTIILKGSFSETLKKIADIDERSKTLTKRMTEAKKNGIDVTESEMHLKNAEGYNANNANSALSSFWIKDEKSALEFTRYAEDELNLAEKSFSSTGKTEIKTTQNATGQPEQNNTTTGFGGTGLILIIISLFMMLRRINYKP